MNGDISNFNEIAYLQANPDVALAVERGLIENGYFHYQQFGKKEGRSIVPSHGASRTEKVMAFLDKNGLGLEIGPSHNPIAPKRLGFKTEIVDHLDKEGLRNKYSGHEHFGVNIEGIEEVDYVWRGEDLSGLIGRTQYYDWIIASHVIEHIPDLVRFLQQCEILLRATGFLSLVIPDKRYCFDHLKPCSSTGELLDAFVEKRTSPSAGQVFEHIANSCKKNGKIAWSESESGLLEFLHSFEQARELFGHAVTTKSYIDSHCWRFTPESFKVVLSDLVMLGLVNLEIARELPTEGCEFYVTLGKKPQNKFADSISENRMPALQARKLSDV